MTRVRFHLRALLKSLWLPMVTVIIGLVVGAIVILATGDNPITAYRSLLQGAGILPKPSYPNFRSIFTDFMTTLNHLTPLLFAALGVSVAFKAGLLNIGVSGQMLFAGFAATMLVGYTEVLSPFIARPLVMIIAALAGGLIGWLIGFLKHKFNIHEVVASIMINFIIMHIVSYVINVRYMDPVARESWPVSPAARLTLANTMVERMGLRMDIPLGLIVALLAAFGVWFFFARTKLGFELKAVGANKNAAEYAGINAGRRIMLAMFLSGMLAGLAGATYYLGLFASIPPRVLPITGFDGIAVSFLASSHPIGIIFAAFLITIIGVGSVYMQFVARVPAEIASVITGTMLLISACSAYIGNYLRSFKRTTKTIADVHNNDR